MAAVQATLFGTDWEPAITDARATFRAPPLAGGVTLADWDILLVNSSGGKDSQTQLRQVYRQAKREGVTDRIVVVHADLGRVDWPGQQEVARVQAEAYGVPFLVTHRRTREGVWEDLLDHAEKRGKWPGPQTRYCTSDHKRGPIRRVMTSTVRKLRKGRRVKLLNIMGIRREESTKRAGMPALEECPEASNGKRSVWDWRPIHDWKETEVWADIRESGIPHHWAYDSGMPRLSCVFCFFASPKYLRLAGKLNPDLLDQYVEIEDRTGHTFTAKLSLRQIREEIADRSLEELTADARGEGWRD